MYLSPNLLTAIKSIEQAHTGSIESCVRIIRSVHRPSVNQAVINFLSQKDVTSICLGMIDSIKINAEKIQALSINPPYQIGNLAESQADKEIALHKAALKELDEDYAASQNKIGFL